MSGAERAELFELDLDLPDTRVSAERRQLIGFDDRFGRLDRSLRLLLEPDTLAAWAKRFHTPDLPLLEVIADRYPLVILHGDVGTGKTAFAEAAAQRLCGQGPGREGHLFKLSTRVRGTGQVGHMSHLINAAFAAVESEAGKHRLAFLIIDEADSLAASRAAEHSHHEDKVGVNTLIQKIDDARRLGGRFLVFLCTNRVDALDPALMRRAGQIERFDRPAEHERRELLANDTSGLGFSDATIEMVVELTGADANDGLGFTFSDLRTRLLPEALLRAYPDRAFEDTDLIESICEENNRDLPHMVGK